MSGRPKSEQGSEKRVHRTTVRWTRTEERMIDQAKRKMGLQHDVDVIRILTLEGVRRVLPSGGNGVAE